MTQKATSIFDLRDIALPEAVSFWPPAPFAGVLLGLLGCGLLLLLLRWRARRRAQVYRREGLALIARIETEFMDQGSTMAGLTVLNVLLKRVALAAFPRRRVAALSGDDWLQFLEASCPGTSFTTGPGRLLADAVHDPSQAARIPPERGRQLVALVRTWIRRHRRPSDESRSP